MAKRTLGIKLELDGARETLKKFRELPKEASQELRDEAKKLSEDLAGSARAAAQTAPEPQAPLLVSTIRARRDRVPSVAVGGSKRIGRFRVPAYELLFGAEFGSNRFKQFHHQHTGQKGTWFFPTVEREQSTISAAWNDAADAVVRKFSQGGA